MKKNLYFSKGFITKTIMSLMMLCIVVGVSAQDLSDGLVLHYTFESATDGTIPDVTGNGNVATINGGAVVGISEDGTKNVVALNGTDAYLTLMSSASTFAALSDYTIATYVNLDAAPGWARIFDFGSGTAYNMFLTVSAGGGGVRYAIKDGSSEVLMTGSSPLPIDEWVHVAVVIEGNEGRLYVNGIEVATGSGFGDGTHTPTYYGEENFTNNLIGDAQYASDPLLDGEIADFRVYNRAITETEVFVLNGLAIELVNAKADVQSIMDGYALTMLESNITLPTTSNGVSVTWTSSNEDVITSEGVITQPAKYAASASLTASLAFNGDTITMKFNVSVLPLTMGSELVAQFLFDDDLIDVVNDTIKVTDLSENAWSGTVMNDASVVSYGSTDPVNVLYTGDGTGYLDMGVEMGEAISSMSDFTMGAYFRIDADYNNLEAYGNFLWTFSNTDDMANEHLGGMYMILGWHDLNLRITDAYYNGDNGVTKVDGPYELGSWHHVAYSQYDGTGYIYLDGVLQASGVVGFTPSLGIKKDTIPGTLFNWLGRSCYNGDAYLKKTMIYDFRVYNVRLTEDDVPYVFGNEDKGWWEISDVLTSLELAVAEGQNLPTSLQDEYDALDLGDLSALTDNITLPATGATDTDVKITWETSSSTAITNEGVVTRPDYVDRFATLTATLKLGVNSLKKSFDATILAKEGTEYSSDLLVNFNFADELIGTDDTLMITDAAEKAFVGKLENGASVRSMESAEKTYKLLYLPNDSAYFDMGDDVGKVVYGLDNHYSTSIYYFIDENKTNYANNGNFVYAFSNSDSSDVSRNGYMFGRPESNEHTVSEYYWDLGNQAVRNDTIIPEQGFWHHFAYVQNDTLGVVYIDGDTMSVAKNTNYPGKVIPKDTLVGTIANFLGRANFKTDAYLGQALLADFKLYNKSLSYDEVVEMSASIADMDFGMILDDPRDPVSAKEITNVPTMRIYSPRKGEIQVVGKDFNEKVYVYDITGRLMNVSTSNTISVESGMHIVKVRNEAYKVVVR